MSSKGMTGMVLCLLLSFFCVSYGATVSDMANEENTPAKMYNGESVTVEKMLEARLQRITLEMKQELRSGIIPEAEKYLGIRYVSGGKTPSVGFDCSGFVGYVMRQSDVWDTPTGSCDSIYQLCDLISMQEAEPGDIVFFEDTYSTSREFTHVGIYLGDGQVIHSASSCGVSVADITSGYWANHYSCIARPSTLM